MADIKHVISGIVEVQDQTISKLKYGNNAIVAISGALNALSATIDNREYVGESLLSANYYKKSETDQKIVDYFSEVSGSITVDVDLDDYYDKATADAAINNAVLTGMNAVREEFNNESFDLKFAAVSGNFFTTTDDIPYTNISGAPTKLSQFENDINIPTIDYTELDPYFAEASGAFVIRDELSSLLSGVHTYDNLKYLNKIYLSSNGIAGYEVFAPIPEYSVSGEIVDLRANNAYFSWINEGNCYYAYASNKTKYGTVYEFPTNVTDFTQLSIGTDVGYGISNGNLYVIGVEGLAANHTNTNEGSLLGTTLTVSKDNWTQVPNISNCYYVRTFIGSVAVLAGDGLSGTLYMGGYNKGLILGTAGYDGNGVPQTTKNNSSNKVNTFLLNTLTPITILENETRITPNDWVKVEKGQFNVIAQRANGKLYTWGSLIYGCNGDGSGYWTDMTDAEVSSVTSGDVTRTLDFGRAEPQVLKVREFASNYNAETNPDAYTDVEYSDWIDFSHTYYHAVAVRKDASTNKNYVYLWGANEYGQFGNGNYLESSLTSSSATADSGIEMQTRPWMLPSSFFPYFDVVKVKATHYGTFLFRENGDVYFAGSNKRNYLGMYSQSSGLDTFFTKFTKINLLSNYYDCETYGSIQVRSVPYLVEDADELIESVLSGELSPEKIADATLLAHRHTVNPAVIDEVVTVASNYVETLPTVLSQSHTHANKTTLNKLTDSNGVLFLDGAPIVAGSSTGGSVVEVDPSNVKLDNFGSILGMSNIAGGYPLDVISYRGDSTNDKSYIVVGQMKEGSFHDFDRWPSVYIKSGSTYTSFMSSDDLRKGGWAIVYKSATVSNSNILSSYLLTSAGSIRQFIEDINKNANYKGYIYDLSAMDSTNWAAGTAIKSAIGKDTVPTSAMYISYESGQVTKDKSINGMINGESNYYPLSSFSGFGVGTQHTSDTGTQYINVYEADGTLLLSSSVISAGIYNDSGSKVKFASQLLDVKRYDVIDDETIPVYYDYYDNDSQTGTPVLLGSVISAGIYKKTGTVYNKITMQDSVEEFDNSLFEVGTEIYIKPSLEDFTGMANQRYEIEEVVPISATTSNGDPVNPYPLEYVILKLGAEVKTDNETETTPTFYPGSSENPMVAIVKSKYRNSPAEVGGEYNAAAGFNSVANGVGNVSVGDYSVTYGVQNTNAGANSFVMGSYNGVTSTDSFVFGHGNATAGSDLFVWGNRNGNDGQTAFIIGSSNFNSGTGNYIFGQSNTTDGNRNYIVGSRNYVAENITDNILIGTNLYSECNKSIAIGWNGEYEKYDGDFPDDTTAQTMTAATLETAINNGTYVSGGLFYQNSFHISMGDVITKNEDKHLDILTYTKYKWEVNDAYFALNNTSSARSGKEPRLVIPDHRWTFTGRMYMNFTEATLKSGSTDSFDVTIRNGGRLKSNDSGLELPASALVEIDYNLGNRFKIKASEYSGTTTFDLINFNDGDELDLIIYNGVDFAFPASWRVDAVKSLAGTNIFVFYKVYNIDGYIIVRFIRLLDSNSDNDISVVDVSSGNYEIVDGIINQIL